MDLSPLDSLQHLHLSKSSATSAALLLQQQLGFRGLLWSWHCELRNGFHATTDDAGEPMHPQSPNPHPDVPALLHRGPLMLALQPPLMLALLHRGPWMLALQPPLMLALLHRGPLMQALQPPLMQPRDLQPPAI